MAHHQEWGLYWNSILLDKYGIDDAKDSDDLFRQVGRTINKKPISCQTFETIVKDAIIRLDLKETDTLVDICCGNGLFTFELHPHVKNIFGVDLASDLIDTANNLKKATNITYRHGNAIDFLGSFGDIFPGIVPDKYFMNSALAYFTPADLEEILLDISSLSKKFRFFITDIPNDTLKWNYYNTEERKQRYLSNLSAGDDKNDGLGRWWHPHEINNICDRLGLRCMLSNQDHALSNYRMDAIIESI